VYIEPEHHPDKKYNTSQEEIDLLKEEIGLLKKLVNKQMSQIEALRVMNHGYLQEIAGLKAEMRRLKELKAKPKIRASKMDKKDDKPDGMQGRTWKRPGSEKRSKRNTLKIDKIEIIKAKDIPVDSKFKGYKKYLVQGLEIRTGNCLFKLERWQLPDGSYKVAELPKNLIGQHFSCELRTYILHQYHHQGVTQPLLLSQLKEWGIDISSGQLNRILTEDKEIFHKEKAEILVSGLAVSDYIQVDDTGARHKGKNGYCTHIGNEFFGWFESTSSKSRVNFLELLRQGQTEYIINEHGLNYMKAHKLAPKYMEQLRQGLRVFETQESWHNHLNKLEITSPHNKRIATEGALIGSLLQHGFKADMAILSDDAGQFNVFLHALCWFHAERKINELIPFGEAQVKAIEEKRNEFWNLYYRLKEYKLAPNEISKHDIEKQFDKLCLPNTCCPSLNKVLKKFMSDKEELLLVLDRPEIPLHNNLSENDIREYVKKRKISGSTRNDAGRKCRDTFTSLKKTCKKLNIQFWDYLLDRLKIEGKILPLSTLVKQKAMAC